MTKKEGIMYALGQLKGYLEEKKDYKTVELKDLFGDKYERYKLGLSNGDNSVCIIDVKSENQGLRRGRFVIEIDRHFYVDDLANLILQGLAFDLKLQKE